MEEELTLEEKQSCPHTECATENFLKSCSGRLEFVVSFTQRLVFSIGEMQQQQQQQQVPIPRQEICKLVYFRKVGSTIMPTLHEGQIEGHDFLSGPSYKKAGQSFHSNHEHSYYRKYM